MFPGRKIIYLVMFSVGGQRYVGLLTVFVGLAHYDNQNSPMQGIM